ncbi:MAG TPA: hypothetical protein VF518_07815, partial [Polyangia bacterium]
MRSRWTPNPTKEEFCMKNQSMISPSRWALALALVSLSAACSDNNGQTPPADAGKADGAAGGGGAETGARDTRVADLGTPDQFVMETGASEAAVADLRPGDAAGADQTQADAPASDTFVVNTADAPVDAPAIDTRPVNPDAPRVDSAAVDSPAVDGAAVDGGSSLVARGKYLVDHVIACSDCHTPKTQTGAPDMTKY